MSKTKKYVTDYKKKFIKKSKACDSGFVGEHEYI